MKKTINRLAIFCGSGTGNNAVYAKGAVDLTDLLYHAGIGVVYGGGRIGLMGVVADHMMKVGGEVIGIIPQKLMDKEVGHSGITSLRVVDTMHQRKAEMASLSDGFIALPGGIGTLEEIIEVFTWLQIGYHQKPCAFLNTNGYFDKLFGFVDHMVEEGFLPESQREKLITAENPNELLDKIHAFKIEQH